MKNVLITGVCGGMGHAVAEQLLREGYQVYGIDVAESVDLPVRYLQANLCEAAAVEEAYAKVSEEVAELTAILHFAGFYTMHSLVEISEAEFFKIFQINLFAVYRVNKTFLPLLKKGSKIVMTSSELAPLDPLPFTGLYAVTKAAIEKYADSLRMELNLLDIRVSVIRPGAVNTGMIDASVRSLERLCNETELYKYNTGRFKKIVNSVETRKIPPCRIAKIACKILRVKKPKYIYNINRNPLLRILSALPKTWQVGIIAGILRQKKN